MRERAVGEVRKGPGGAPDVTALQEARAVGKNVVRMARRLGAERSGLVLS